MRGRWLAAIGIQTGLLVATAPLDGFGAAGWHHVASLAAVLVGFGVFWQPMTASRRVLAIGALVTAVLAIVSGFFLLYGKEWVRPAGFQDWLVWWHVAWSWAATLFFFQHTWINRVQFVHFFRRATRGLAGAGHVLGYAVIVAFLVWSGTVGKDAFSAGNYIAWSFANWLAALVPAFGISLVQRGAVLPWRRGVDLALVPMTALATLSGVPLLFLGTLLDDAGLKYASKFWHTGPSIVFSVLVFVHTVQLWRAVRRHLAARA